jgi:integrase
MRVFVALGLRCDDVDLTAGVLTVRQTKSGWPRILPLHDTTTDVLRGYIRDRARWWPSASDAFFLGSSGKPLAYPGVRGRFRALTTELGIGVPDVLPRIHDLRHTFAVNTLLRWHRTGADIAAGLPVLSTYLGHVDPTCTY